MNNNELTLFEGKTIRHEWNAEENKMYFSVVDVVGVLTDQPTTRGASNYWKVLKNRLKAEGANELVTNCNQLKLVAEDGKRRLTDVADLEQLFRIIQSIPSPKAEPIKQWLAKVASQRVDQIFDPELSIRQAVRDYARLGYSEQWIKSRIRSIEARNELTDEWQRAGIEDDRDYAILTNILTKTWSGKTVGEYKQYKGLRKENLRDNMTTLELALNTLAEASTAEISKQREAQGLHESMQAAQDGGNVAKVARQNIEEQIGRSVVSPLNVADMGIIPPSKRKKILIQDNKDNNSSI